MFGRKPPAGPTSTPAQPVSAAPRPATALSPARPAAADGDAAPRLVPAQPVAQAAPIRRPAEPIRQEPARDLRKLNVGRDIALAGEIAACDHLIVEGTVEAKVKDCHRMEIAESGLFRGAVEISEADIGGRFEGELVVSGRLTVRSTGRIEGKIQYGELAVESGGTLDGEIKRIAKTAAKPIESPAATPIVSAPVFVAEPTPAPEPAPAPN